VAPSPETMRIWVDVVFTGAEGYTEFLQVWWHYLKVVIWLVLNDGAASFVPLKWLSAECSFWVAQSGTCFITDSAASRRSDQKTSWHRFSCVDVAPGKRLRTFFYRIYPKENIVYTGSCSFFIWKTDEISRTLHLMV
jgi:hypothetical protein